MSYDVRMVCPCCDHYLSVEHFAEGGTHPDDGTSEATINITHTYSPYYYTYLVVDGQRGLRSIYGKTGAKVGMPLLIAIASIEADTMIEDQQREMRESCRLEWLVDDYWCPTKAHAAEPLRRLLSWAKQHPTGVFGGD